MVALATTFILLFMTKTGVRDSIRDFCDERKLYLVAEMFNCDFCLGFWSNLIIASIFVVITGDPNYLFVPVFSTPITRFLL